MRYKNVATSAAAEEPLTFSVISGMRGGWRVLRNYRGRALGSYELKRDAVKHARDAARKAGAELVVHDEQGYVEDERFYTRRSTPAIAKR